MDILTWLTQPTIRLRPSRMEHVNGRKFTEKKKEKNKKKNNKVEEIQLANLSGLGSLASKNGCNCKPGMGTRMEEGVVFAYIIEKHANPI